MLSLLQTRPSWSGADLANRLGVTTRTIRNDIERLRALGYQVHSSTGVTGGYRLVAGSQMPPLLFDDDEAVAVAVGLHATAAGTDLEEPSLGALAKLEQTLPTRLRHRLETFRRPTSAGSGSTSDTTARRDPEPPRPGAGSTAYRHQARIRLYASAEAIAGRVTPAGRLRPVGAHNCVLETGADSLADLVDHLTSLDVRFEVLDPPELRTLLRQLADRYRVAAGERP